MSDHEARINAGSEPEGTPGDVSNEDVGLETPEGDEGEKVEEGDSGA